MNLLHKVNRRLNISQRCLIANDDVHFSKKKKNLQRKPGKSENRDRWNPTDRKKKSEQETATMSAEDLIEWLTNSGLDGLAGRLEAAGVGTLNDLGTADSSHLELVFGGDELADLLQLQSTVREVFGIQPPAPPDPAPRPFGREKADPARASFSLDDLCGSEEGISSSSLDISRPLGLSLIRSLRVTRIVPGGQAFGAGIAPGAVVTSLAGEHVACALDFRGVLHKAKDYGATRVSIEFKPWTGHYSYDPTADEAGEAKLKADEAEAAAAEAAAAEAVAAADEEAAAFDAAVEAAMLEGQRM